MTMFKISNFCLIVAREAIVSLLYSLDLFMVMSLGFVVLVMVLIVYLCRCMVCFVKIRNYFPLYVIIWACIYA